MAMPADVIGYANAADTYWQAGWRSILPLRRGAKISPPKGFTGYNGVEPSYPDVLQWAEEYPDGNLCLRLPDGIIGIDVDAYGAKTGAAALGVAEARWGPLPPGPRSTARADRVSGIRLFKVPTGTLLEDAITFADLGIGDIEIIQRHHRYVVCWPSIHPEGEEYWWRNADWQLIGIPVVDELPWLPQDWINGLRVTPRSLNLNGEHYDVRKALTPGDSSIEVSSRFTQAVKELNLPGQSRHDTCCRHVMALLGLGKNDQPGVLKALELLREVFVAVVVSDNSRTPDVARAEFDRMITNPNAARELAQPGINDWLRALATENGADSPFEGAAPSSVVTPVDNLTATRDAKSRLEEIEQGFWDSRESLHMIYTTAMARMCPPWAVLAHTAARALAQVRPHVALPPLIGPGSLNWFAAVVAASGGGKGAASACARLLIPGHVETRNVGSGEGIIAAFGRPAEDDDSPTHEALLFTADEVDTLAAMNQRSASTTLSVLRSGFSGETLGFSYAAKEKRRHIGAGTYRMTLVMSVQPTRAGWLLADGGGGTPQRFMWFPGTDKRISRNRPWPPGPLILPPTTEWQYPREIAIPDAAAELIIDERVKSQNGDQAALDGHALFCREKFAYALTVLDGRTDMTSEDWELSGIASAISTYTRELTIEAIEEASRIEALDRGEIRGVENAAADAAKAHEQMERARRVLRWLLATIENAESDGILKRDLSRKIAGRDRRYLDPALEHAASSGLIRQIEETGRWVKR